MFRSVTNKTKKEVEKNLCRRHRKMWLIKWRRREREREGATNTDAITKKLYYCILFMTASKLNSTPRIFSASSLLSKKRTRDTDNEYASKIRCTNEFSERWQRETTHTAVVHTNFPILHLAFCVSCKYTNSQQRKSVDFWLLFIKYCHYFNAKRIFSHFGRCRLLFVV